MSARRWVAIAVAAAAVLPSARAFAQQSSVPGRLTLAEALELARERSEGVAIARAGVTRTTGQRKQARSQYYPQINGTLGITRTLRSQFSSLGSNVGGGSTAADTFPALCSPRIPADAPPDARRAALDQAVTCSATGGFDLSQTAFGAKNQWSGGLSVDQSLFSGGRIGGQVSAAEAGRRAAVIEVDAQRAQADLDVVEAYYDAILADQLVTIADSSVAQTETVVRQTQVGQRVGKQSEFDLLQAQVSRDNQRSSAIRARGDRDVAYARLSRLVGMQLEGVFLETSVVAATDDLPLSVTAEQDTSVSARAPVRQAEQSVLAQRGQLKVARAERLPQVSLVSGYQRLYFPAAWFPNFSSARENWSVGIQASVPIFNGGRLSGDRMVAQAGVDQALAQLDLTRDLAALDAKVAVDALEQAESAVDATSGTSGQAQRAYAIDLVRFQQGISSQTDLIQSRLMLEQARANLARAARDLAVARVRLRLLRNLPLQSGPAVPQATPAAPSVETQTQTQQQRITLPPMITPTTAAGGVQ